jgi:glycosyltransferase involved in cell wall biosynthesis
MKILFVPNWYPLHDGTAQIGECCREHVRAASLYEDVAVLAFTARADRCPTLQWKRVEDVAPTFYATYGQSPIPKTTLPVFLLHLRRALRRVIEEWGFPDVIHTQDAYAYYVMKAVSFRKIPVVISQHWTVFMERQVTRRLLRQFKWAFSRAARVLPDNKFAGREYQHYGLQASVRWLPNAVDIKTFHPPASTARRPWLLHASGMTAQKRFPDVIEAFARVCHKRPQAILHVVGDGASRAEMERLAVQRLPRHSFQFHGYLAKSALAEIMRQASGFILPSQAENMPCVLIEALACGCPVLTTRVGGITALIREGQGILVDVGNIEQIAEGMCRLLDGSHGFNMQNIAHESRELYGHEAVGQLLHEEYLKAAGL